MAKRSMGLVVKRISITKGPMPDEPFPTVTFECEPGINREDMEVNLKALVETMVWPNKLKGLTFTVEWDEE